jgi:hypothetical protein
MSAPNEQQHTSAFDLDRWILAGRPAGHSVTEHAASCPECSARIEAPGVSKPVLEPSGALIEGRIDAIFREAETRRAGPLAKLASVVRRPWALAPALAVAAAVMVFVFAAPMLLEAPKEGDRSLGWKAGGEVVLKVSVGGAPEPAGSVLAPGALLAVDVTVARKGHLALLSVDAGGAVSQVLPARGEDSLAVEPGVVHARGAVSPSTGVERLLVLFGDAPFRIGAAAEIARQSLDSDVGTGGAEVGLGPRVAASWWFRHAGDRR